MCTNVGEGFPVASQFMPKSSTLKTVTDSGCVVITGGLLTASSNNSKTVHLQNHQIFRDTTTKSTTVYTVYTLLSYYCTMLQTHNMLSCHEIYVGKDDVSDTYEQLM